METDYYIAIAVFIILLIGLVTGGKTGEYRM